MLLISDSDHAKCDIVKNLPKGIVFSCFSGNNAHPNVSEKSHLTRETLLIDHGLGGIETVH
jgi:hypothetical protein